MKRHIGATHDRSIVSGTVEVPLGHVKKGVKP